MPEITTDAPAIATTSPDAVTAATTRGASCWRTYGGIVRDVAAMLDRLGVPSAPSTTSDESTATERAT